MAVVAVIPTLAGFVVLFTVTRRSQKYFIAQQKDLGVINGIVEKISTVIIIRTYNGMLSSVSKFEEVNACLFRGLFKARVATSMMP